MHKAVVLGCGLVGKVIARDLASDRDFEVMVHDISEKNLAAVRELPRISVHRTDLSSATEIRAAVAPADVVVGAVPGFLAFQMLGAVVEAGKPIVDISFAPEDAMQLDDAARRRGVTAVVDCGVSPGLSNLAIGRAAAQLDEVETAVIYVGGLPRVRHWPFEYRSVFSPTDVIEEYTRPARMIEGGSVVIKEALSEVETIDFAGVGTLEAFNTDGLRTLLTTIRARNMREKTLRYPGHADRMRMLRETGLFANTPVEVDGTKVVPRRLTEKLMFELWKRAPDEEELTVLRVVVEGPRNQSRHRITFELLDRTDFATQTTSMARTTGFPCAIVARMLARGQIREVGIRPPELLARDRSIYDAIVSGLTERDVKLRETSEDLTFDR